MAWHGMAIAFGPVSTSTIRILNYIKDFMFNITIASRLALFITVHRKKTKKFKWKQKHGE